MALAGGHIAAHRSEGRFVAILRTVLALVLCMGEEIAHAEQRLPPLSNFVHRAWTARTGAPGEITDFAQTSDGMIWIASGSGLFEFDGVRFVQIPGKPGGTLDLEGVYCLYAPATGGLWVGLRFGGLVFLEDDRITEYPPGDVIPSGTVNALGQDRNGVLWAATAVGLLNFKDGRWQRIGSERGLPASYVSTLYVDRSDAIWVYTKEGLYRRDPGTDAFVKQPLGLSSRKFAVLRGIIAESENGTLWIGDVAKDPKPSRSDRARVLPGATALQFDENGALWFTSGSDVRRIVNAREVAGQNASAEIEAFDRSDGLLGDVNIFFKDRDGDLWVGSSEGIDLFVPTRLHMVRQIYTSFAMATASDGSLWWAEADYNETRWHVNHYVDDRIVEKLDVTDPINCAYADADGTLWFAGHPKVWRFDGKQFDLLPSASDVAGLATQAMARGGDGSLWRSVVRGGVFRYTDGQWRRNGGLGGLPDDSALVMKADGSGRLWFGYTNNRLARVDADAVKMFGPADGVNVGNVTAIETRGKRVWVGGERGLLLSDGDRFEAVRVAGDDPYRSLWGVVETKAGELWAAGGRSLIRLNRAQLAEVLEHRIPNEPPQLLDYRDGIVGLIQNLRPLPALQESGDGRIWFALSNGLGFVDPRDLSRETAAPAASIQSVRAGGRDYSPFAKDIQLPMHTEQLRIAYTAASFAAPERIRFRYKLEGLDGDWQDVGEQREAVYTNLSPGTYRFEISAANRDGPWSANTSLTVRIPPALYQTVWFDAFVALAAVSLLSLLYKLRMRQISLQVRSRLEERIGERERIARELHDTLLQGFQGLVLHLQAVAYRVEDERENAHELIEETLKRADTVLEDGRNRVQDLRATEAPIDLSKIFLQVSDSAQPHSAKVRVTVEGVSRELHPIVCEEVERIGVEAITNALRHARASQIEVYIAFQRRRFELRISDDGVGIDPEFLAAGRDRHFGLKGMRERARKIRATLSIVSGPADGTEVELIIPASVAYVPQPWRSGHFWKHRAFD